MRKNYILTALFFCIISLSIFALNKIELIKNNNETKKPISNSSRNLNVLPPPNANISGSADVCKGDPSPQINFTGSSGPPPYTFTYKINSGADIVTNSTIINVNTGAIGTFIYELVSVEDGTGDMVTFTNKRVTVTVGEPTVDFTFDNSGACAGTDVSFTSTVTGNAPFTYLWRFSDDGSTSTSNNPTHAFTSIGCGSQNVNVELTVTDDNGCTNTITKAVLVQEKPDIDFKDANFSNPAQYFNNCSNTSSDETFTITVENISNSTCVSSYTIDWGDGNTEPFNSTNISHTYTYSDTFRMQIIGIGSNGCENTKTYIVKNASNPQGNIVSPGGTQNLCAPAEIAFTISSNWGANSIDTVYVIDYGDGTTVTFLQEDMITSSYFNSSDPKNSTPYPVPHTYSDSNCPSDFEAIISIQNSCATTPGNSGGIRILKNAVASFENDEISCINTQTIFENTSESASAFDCSGFIEFTWDFGDGTTPIKTFDYSSVDHIYLNSGNYTVTLIANNGICDETSFQEGICIEPQLTAAFSLDANNGCAPLAIQTTNTTDLSSSCGSEAYLWEVTYVSGFCGTAPEQWNFTNSTDETSATPSISFLTAGTYTLQLTTTNSCGTSVASETIEVKQPPTTTISSISDFCGTASITPTATVENCAPSSETITYSWTFTGGIPATANTLVPGTVTYATPGDYQVSFSITNSCGTTTDTEDFSVNPIPSVTNTDLTQTICSGTDTTILNLTSDITGTSFLWTATAPSGVSGYTTSGSTDIIPIQTIFNSDTTAQDVTYIITPSIGGCSGTSVSLVITVDPAPAFTSQPQPETICLNGPISPLSITVNGPGTPSYQWYSNTINSTTGGTSILSETNATFTPPNTLVGITYYYNVVSFSSGAGCNEITSDIASVEIVDGIQIDTNPLTTQSICHGGDITAPLSVVHSGGTGTISYQWYVNTTNSNTGGALISGATNINYTPPTFTSSGDFYYYVIISLNGSGCSDITSDVAEVIVVNDPIITTQPLNTQTLCQGIIPVDLEIIVSGGLGGIYNYQWYSNTTDSNTGGNLIVTATNSIYTPSTTAVGTLYYYAVITQPDPGCSVTSNTSEVIVNAAPNFTAQPISNTYCLGDPLNTLSVTYANGVGTPAYQWYSNTVDDSTTGTAITGATTSTFNPPSGTVGTVYYYAIITFSSGGCTQITSNVAEIIINQTPSVSLKSDIICSANAFTIIPNIAGGDIAPSGTTYTWTTPIVSPSGTITGATSQATPQTTISQTLTNTTINPSTVTYTITPTTGICIGNDFTVTITVNPSISITNNPINSNCYLASNGSIDITISGGVPFSTGNPYQISWTGPNGYINTIEDISNLAPGNYTVNILDDGGCPYNETFTIIEPDELIFSAIDFDPETISCFDADDGNIGITVTGGTLPYQYNWTKNTLAYATTKDLSNLDEGVYEITVIDANSCTPITQSFTIIEPADLEVSLNNQVDIICFGDATGEIYINTIGGRQIETNPSVFDYSYSWTGPNGYTSNTQNITNLFAGTYNLTVTDKSSCTDTLEVILIETGEIIIDYTATEIKCYGDNDASITIDNISGGNPPYAVTWSNLGSGMAQSNLSAGDYTITVTDITNCPKAVTITIDEAPIFEMTPITNNVSCFGANDGRIILNLVGGIDPVSLVWDDDATAGVERNNIGPGTYSVTITDGTPCEIAETFVITEPDELGLSANTVDALDCDDSNSGSINLIVTGGTLPLAYLWSNGDTTEDLNTIPPGNYTVTVIDANNCEVSENWDINRFEPLSVDVEVVTDFNCTTRIVNQTFVAKPEGGVPPYTINWSSGIISGVNGELMNTSQNGLVTIDIEDNIGCITSHSYNVQIPVLGDADFNITSSAFSSFDFYSVQDPIQFTNTAIGDFISVSWDFGDGNFSTEENPAYTYIKEGAYSVEQTVTYPFGCVYTKQISLVIEKGYNIIMPNAFTPNGDTMNAYFVPESIALSNMTFNIYNTWGSLIYSETGDSIKGWNGKTNDADAENGNYYYTFEGSTFYGEIITRKGAFVSIK